MLYHLDHLIKRNQPIDYYVCYYPRMVTAYFQCVNGSVPLEPYSYDIQEHIQAVIEEHNNDLSWMQKSYNDLVR